VLNLSTPIKALWVAIIVTLGDNYITFYCEECLTAYKGSIDRHH